MRLLFLILSLLASPVFADTDDAARFKNIHNYALIADAAYYGKEQVAKVLAAQGYTLTDSGQLPGYAVSYYLATNDAAKQQLLAIRGTSNMENAIVDVAVNLLPNKHTGIKIHQGFANSADYTWSKVEPKLNSGYVINTTGHSLGGAVALILAMYLDADGYNVGKVVTFGQPKVTNMTGSRQYGHLDVTRVVTPRDIVPLLPPLDPMDMMSMDIYWHQGTELVLMEGNSYAELEGVDSVMRATDFLNEMLSEKNVQHHFMAEYIKLIAPKLVNSKQVPYQNNFSIYDWLNSGTSGK